MQQYNKAMQKLLTLKILQEKTSKNIIQIGHKLVLIIHTEY